jgi:hypothetical protein
MCFKDFNRAERTEEVVLETYRVNNIGPMHLENKIEETYGIHISHNRIYRVLLNHDLVEINMKKRQQRRMLGMNELIPSHGGRVTGNNSRLMVRNNGLLHSGMIHRVS